MAIFTLDEERLMRFQQPGELFRHALVQSAVEIDPDI
jgi:hypothetical protein